MLGMGADEEEESSCGFRSGKLFGDGEYRFRKVPVGQQWEVVARPDADAKCPVFIICVNLRNLWINSLSSSQKRKDVSSTDYADSHRLKKGGGQVQLRIDMQQKSCMFWVGIDNATQRLHYEHGLCRKTD